MLKTSPVLFSCLLAMGAGCAPSGSVALVPPAARVARSTDLGPLAVDTELDFVVGLSLTSDSVSVGKFLSERPRGPGMQPVEFAQRFSPPTEKYDHVVAWLRSAGMTVTRTTDSRTTISARGTAGAIEKLFEVQLHQYRDGSELFAAPTTPLRIASEFVGQVNGVVGLSGSAAWHSHLVRPTAPQPEVGVNGLTATEIETMYNSTGIVNPGMGETVAILGGNVPPDPIVDIGGYFLAMFGKGATPDYEQVFVGGANRDPEDINGAGVENALDAEMVLAMAPKAHVVHVFVASLNVGLFTDGMSYIVNQLPAAHAVTVSFGGCERGSEGEVPVVNTLLQQAQAEGQQWFFASGDSGTDGCRDGTGNKHIAADWPASSPYAVAVGGTQIDAVSMAEVVWNQNSNTMFPGAGGGAPSELFVKPAYQMGVTPADGARDIPDVSAIAGSPDVNVYLLSQNFPVGGTSVASPLWAGVWSLVDQAHGGTGLTDGLTRIYAAGASSGFNDITKGDNGGPDDTSAGYPAGPGYDLATGWGSPNVANLVTSIK